MELTPTTKTESIKSYFFKDCPTELEDIIKNYSLNIGPLHEYGRFPCDPNITAICFHPLRESIIIGDSRGRIVEYNLKNICKAKVAERDSWGNLHTFSYGKFPHEILRSNGSIQINALVMSASGKHLVIGTAKNQIILFDTETRKESLCDIKISEGEIIKEIFLDPKEKYIITTTDKSKFYITSVELSDQKINDRACLFFQKKFSYIKAIAFDPTGKYLAVGNVLRNIDIIDTTTWKRIKKYKISKIIQDNDFIINRIVYSPCGTFFAVALSKQSISVNSQLLLFNTRTEGSIELLQNVNEIVNMNFHPTEPLLTIGTRGEKNKESRQAKFFCLNFYTKKNRMSSYDDGHNKYYFIDTKFNSLGNWYVMAYSPEVILYHKENITLHQHFFPRLILLWFQVKNQWDIILKIHSSVKKHGDLKLDSTQNVDKFRVNLFLQHIAEDFCCDYDELKNTWSDLSHCMKEFVHQVIDDMTRIHKRMLETRLIDSFKQADMADIKKIESLITRGVDVNRHGDYYADNYDSILHLAVKYLQKNPDGKNIILQLIRYGADVDRVNNFGCTAFGYAIHEHPWEDAAEILITNGAKLKIVRANSWAKGTTALMLACYHNYPKVVQLLLSANECIDVKNQLGQDAFYFADQHEDKQCLVLLNSEKERLLKKDLIDSHKETPVSSYHYKWLMPIGIIGIIYLVLTMKSKNI